MENLSKNEVKHLAKSIGLRAEKAGSNLPVSSKGRGKGHKDGENAIPAKVGIQINTLSGNNAGSKRYLAMSLREKQTVIATLLIDDLDIELAIPLVVEGASTDGITIRGGFCLSKGDDQHSLDFSDESGVMIDPTKLDSCLTETELVRKATELRQVFLKEDKYKQVIADYCNRVKYFIKMINEEALTDAVKAMLWAKAGGTGDPPQL